MRDNKRNAVICMAVTALDLIAAIVYMIRLPDTVPTHFDVTMVCDRVGSRWLGALLPAVMFIITIVLFILSFKWESSEKKAHNIGIWMPVFTVLDVVVTWYILFLMGSGAGVGDKMDLSLVWLLPAVLGAIFAMVGNYLPTVRQNMIIGYRISWTLENEQCWKLTHQFAGKLAFISGILLCIIAVVMRIVGVQSEIAYTAISFVVMNIVIIFPVVYAYMHKDDV